MKITKLLKELDKLDIPRDKMAISSSGPLGIRNLREIGDLDIIVYPEVWRGLSTKYTVTKKEGSFESINVGNIQILGPGSWFTGPDLNGVKKYIDDAEVINGYRYDRLERVLTIKRKKKKIKDEKDVTIIEDYLRRQK